MTTDTALYTIETLPTLADDRWELVAGRIVPKVSTSFRHSRTQLRLGGALLQFSDDNQLGSAVTELSVVVRRDPDTIRVPDVAFISFDRWPDPLAATFCTEPPELVVEILSPSNIWSEIDQKLEEYFAFGVDRVWIVDPDRQLVFVYRSPDERTTLTATDTILGEGILAGFSMPVAGLFAPRPSR